MAAHINGPLHWEQLGKEGIPIALATLRPWRGAMRTINIPVKLPDTLPDGPVR